MKSRTSLAVLFFFLASFATAQTIRFDAYPYPTPTYSQAQWRADLNGDGREDVISMNTDGGPAAFNVLLSNGDGSYGPGQTYQIDPNRGNVFLTIGDFNGDGKLDIIACTGATKDFLEFLNNGDGTLHLQAHWGQPVQVFDVQAADWNHDGKVDIAYTSYNGTVGELHLLFNNGASGFNVGPVSNTDFAFGHLHTGDVDGDGKADLMTVDGTDVAVWYGDGNGHFSQMTHYREPNPIEFVPFDVDGDGKTDLIGVPWIRNTTGGASTFYPKLRVIYGNSARTLTGTDLALDQCSDPDSLPAVADFNGDGIPDVALQTFPCGATGPYTIRLYPGAGNRTVGVGQVIYGTSDFVRALLVLRGNSDSKPDLVVTPASSPTRVELLVNAATLGTFPGCPPVGAIGFTFCSSTTNATSPVPFSIGASGQTEMRKIEVWVDGAKKLESLENFSHYVFLDGSIAMANGSHSVTVYAAGWDNLLQKTSFTMNVGSSGGGGGGTCATPSTSTAVNICAPANGSTVSSPVHVSAAGGSAVTFMEVWVDGTKPYQTSGNKVDTFLTLGNGSHTMTIYGRNSSGVIGKSTVTFTVNGNGGATCAPATATSIVICSPTNGSTVSNPVNVVAQGGSSVNFIEVWIDGTKRAQAATGAITYSVTLPLGSHHLTVFGKNGSTVLSKAVSDFTVH